MSKVLCCEITKLPVLGSSCLLWRTPGSGSSKKIRMDPIRKKIGSLGLVLKIKNSGSDSQSGNQTQFQLWFSTTGSENGS
jgi:hypothetical protein